MDNVKFATSNQCTEANETVMANIQELRQSLDVQITKIDDVKTSITTLLPERPISSTNPKPSAPENNQTSLSAPYSSIEVNQKELRHGMWLPDVSPHPNH
jgi:hypothetical protein